jgi:hypothetical protein
MNSENSPSASFFFDAVDQVNWLNERSEYELKDWLRRVVWLESVVPLFVRTSDEIFSQTRSLFHSAQPAAKIKIRKIIPELLREWQVSDKPVVLERLIAYAGEMGCVEAERYIVRILRQDIDYLDNANEYLVRREALKTLSGFGCSERSIEFFKEYITDIKYADICFWALYEDNPSEGAALFDDVVNVYILKNKIDALAGYVEEIGIELLDGDYKKIVDFWRRVFVATFNNAKSEKDGASRLNFLISNLKKLDITVDFDSVYSDSSPYESEKIVVDLKGVSELFEEKFEIQIKKNTNTRVDMILTSEYKILAGMANLKVIRDRAGKHLLDLSRNEPVVGPGHARMH